MLARGDGGGGVLLRGRLVVRLSGSAFATVVGLVAVAVDAAAVAVKGGKGAGG